MTVEQLQAHHTVLVAQRDQLMANFNASLGAIAFCEQMIAEAMAERAATTAKQLQEAAEAMASKMPSLDYCTVGGPDNCEAWAKDKRCGSCPVTDAPEMLPVQPEDRTPWGPGAIDEDDYATEGLVASPVRKLSK